MSKQPWPARHDQRIAGKFIFYNRKAGLFMDMGLGKTVVCLSVLQALIYRFEIIKPLIIAPVRVVESVWMQEADKWQHLQIKGKRVTGTPKQRIEALRAEADYYLISCDNAVWLTDYYKTAFPFDMVIIDESSKFKSSDSQRFRALKRVITGVERVVILTGTPAPNGLIDLWPQLYLLDSGERLENTVTRYRDKYFIHNAYSHKYKLKERADKVITHNIKDICISMTGKDYLKDLPELTINDIHVNMDDELKEQYNKFKKEQVLLLKDKEITALTAQALGIKLLQFANGAIYDDKKNWHLIHNLKLDALEDIIEEANGNNVLVAYCYQHDLQRILKKFKFAKHLATDKELTQWNEGRIRVGILHPASGGHGLNLQYGGHIAAHFGLNWNLELYQQFNKRIHRPGQKEKVILHRLLMSGTDDLRVADVLAGKDATQSDLLASIKILIDEILNS